LPGTKGLGNFWMGDNEQSLPPHFTSCGQIFFERDHARFKEAYFQKNLPGYTRECTGKQKNLAAKGAKF
jgi:hypothetical protein